MIHRKVLAAAVAAASLAVPASALAAQPDGQWNIVPKANSHASVIGQESSQITQNGQYVGGVDKFTTVDQTTAPGSRADLVQTALGHTN